MIEIDPLVPGRIACFPEKIQAKVGDLFARQLRLEATRRGSVGVERQLYILDDWLAFYEKHGKLPTGGKA